MTKCTTALGIVPGNSILVYMRVPAAKSDLHITRVSSILHFLFASVIYWVGFDGVNYLIAICCVGFDGVNYLIAICWVGFGGVNHLICSTCLNQLFPSCMCSLPSHRAFGVDVYTVGRPKAMSCWCEGQAGSWVSGMLSINVLCDGENWCNLRLQSMICSTWLITPTQ